MKKLMLEYLCLRFPDAYRKKTDFGIVLYHTDNQLVNYRHHKDVLDNMISMFSCSEEDAFTMLNAWTNSRTLV